MKKLIPKECKRLAEVDFPIAEVSRHAIRDKSTPPGHPATLHLWWARRPLASSRAMLLALLLPDPADPHCPDAFRAPARAALLNLPGRPARWDAELQTNPGLRQGLLKFIADFADWRNAASPAYLAAGRALVNAAHPAETPLVADPFAGGGAIPLEALRLGCDAFASDLNPIARLILKTLLEDIPRRGPELAGELKKAGAEIKAQAEAELADLYPKDPDGALPIAYLWARTVHCEAPNCGAEIPLLRSLWLCRNPNRQRALRPKIIREAGAPPRIEFGIFAPQADREVAGGTVSRSRATCPACQTVLPSERVRSQLAAQRGGADTQFDEPDGRRIGGARMTAVVTQKPGETVRHYRLPTDADYAVVRRAQQQVTQLLTDWELNESEVLCPIPNEPMPPIGTLGFRIQRYGMMHWGDLFTARQKITLLKVAHILSDGENMIGLSLGKIARHCNVLSKWHTGSETVAGAFGMHALPMSWDFPEMSPFVAYSGGIENAVADVVASVSASPPYATGQAHLADAVSQPLPNECAAVWFTDPPYYDAIPYADLSDFYLVWHKRRLMNNPILQDPFDPSNPLAPKEREIVQDESRVCDGHPKTRQWFEEKMAQAFAEGRRVLNDDGIGSVVFAHKTTEGWEALLSGMIRGGWTITGSWPVSTERGARLRARDSAALATSVHLVCRPRPADAPVGDWSQVLAELPGGVAHWMPRLQAAGIQGADLVFACIGPALEIFSRYAAVETPAGEVIGLPQYLEKVWEVVGRAALEQILGAPEAQARHGALGALEEDARLTALFLWTLQSSGPGEPAPDDPAPDAAADAETEPADANSNARPPKGYRLLYDVVRRFAQPLGIHLEQWKSRTIDLDKGVVRLLPVTERAPQLLESPTAAALTAAANPANPHPQQARMPLEPATPTPTKSPAATATLAETATETDTKSPADTATPTETAPETPAQARRRRAGNPPAAPTPPRQPTTLDQVHTAMLFQHTGRSHALRALIRQEQEKGPQFLRLANALSALYPPTSPEKRLLDAMLLAVPR